MLGDLVRAELARRNISQREAAKEIGISHTTLVAVKEGKEITVSTAYLVCQWLGVPLTAAVSEVTPRDEALVLLGNALQVVPQLEKVFITAAQAVHKGQLTQGDFREIMQFAAFKIQQRKEEIRSDEIEIADQIETPVEREPDREPATKKTTIARRRRVR